MYYVIQISLACQQCIADQTEDTCTHKKDSSPPWKPKSRQKLVESMLSGDRELSLRELSGVIVSNSLYVFAPYIKQFQALSVHVFQSPVRLLFMAIDPSGGGMSEYAITTWGYEDGRFVVRCDTVTCVQRACADNVSSTRSVFPSVRCLTCTGDPSLAVFPVHGGRYIVLARQ